MRLALLANDHTEQAAIPIDHMKRSVQSKTLDVLWAVRERVGALDMVLPTHDPAALAARALGT
jgi:hypothetical protein